MNVHKGEHALCRYFPDCEGGLSNSWVDVVSW